jgi:hypothetical protein
MTPIIVRTAYNQDRADQQVRDLTAELRDDHLAPDVLKALNTVGLPDMIERRIRDWIAAIRSATPADAFDLDRLVAVYRSLVVLYLGAFHYKAHWPQGSISADVIPSLEMIERTPAAPVQRMQIAVGHLAIALHGEEARGPLHDAMMSEPLLLRSIAEKATEKIGSGPRAG